MSFFDAKEEVIEIQLTPDGKRLFAEGKFKPTFYQFFDDDITYDSAAAGISEVQNDSQDRIKSTPRVKITNIYGVDTEQKLKIKNSNNLANPNKELCRFALGTSDYTTQFAPAWNIKNYKATIDSSNKAYVIGSGNINLAANIPQITISSSYNYKTPTDANTYELMPEYSFSNTISTVWNSQDYETETYKPFGPNVIILEQQNVPILDVMQENAILDKEGYTLEVFIVEQKNITQSGSAGIKTLTEELLSPLSFNELEKNEKKKVSSYFDLMYDQELLNAFGAGELNIFDPYSNPLAPGVKEAEPCE